jgi:hypothetical protein
MPQVFNPRDWTGKRLSGKPGETNRVAWEVVDLFGALALGAVGFVGLWLATRIGGRAWLLPVAVVGVAVVLLLLAPIFTIMRGPHGPE